MWEEMPALPRTLSHVVHFVPDIEVGVNFYVNRLGFVVTDELKGAGPFLRPKANDDHHTLFFIRTPRVHEGLRASRLSHGRADRADAGGHPLRQGRATESFWGPGRHKFGSNWFWYFNSPLGCHFEYDADMDKHDDSWVARAGADGRRRRRSSSCSSTARSGRREARRRARAAGKPA